MRTPNLLMLAAAAGLASFACHALTAKAITITGPVNAVVDGDSPPYSPPHYSCLVLSGKPFACWLPSSDQGREYFGSTPPPPAMPAFRDVHTIEFGIYELCIWDAKGIQCILDPYNGPPFELVVPASAGIHSLDLLSSDWGSSDNTMYDPFDVPNSGAPPVYAPPVDLFCADTEQKGRICWSNTYRAPFSWPTPFSRPEQIAVTWTNKTIEIPHPAKLYEAVTCALYDGEVLCEAEPEQSFSHSGNAATQGTALFAASRRLLPVPPLGPVSKIRRVHCGPEFNSHVCATTPAGETCWTYLDAPNQDGYLIDEAPKPSPEHPSEDPKTDAAFKATYIDGWLSHVTIALDRAAQVVYASKSKTLSQLSHYISALPATQAFSLSDARMAATLWLLNAWAPVIDGSNSHDAIESMNLIKKYQTQYSATFEVKTLSDIGSATQRPELRAAAFFTLGTMLDLLSTHIAQPEKRQEMQKLAADFSSASAQPPTTPEDLLARLLAIKPLLIDLSTVSRAKDFALTALVATDYLEAK